jgi:hypothetical protein
MIQTTLTPEQQDWFAAAADEIDASFRSYSGRYMNGKTCLSIVVGCVTDLAMFVLVLSECDPHLAEHLARNAAVGSMGYDHVIYWPAIAPIPTTND